MTYRTVELLISVVFIAVFIWVLIAAGYITQLPFFDDLIGAQGFSYGLATIGLLCSLVLLGTQVLRLRRGEVSLSDPEDPEVTGDDPQYPASTIRAFSMIGLLVLYVAALIPLGYILSSIAFCAIATWVMGARGVVKLAVFPLVYAISTYLLFDTVLSVRLPPGVLQPILRSLGLE